MKRIVLLILAGCVLLGLGLFVHDFLDDGQDAERDTEKDVAPLRPKVKGPGREERIEPVVLPTEVHDVEVVTEASDPMVPGELPWELRIQVPGLSRGKIDGAKLLEVLKAVAPVRFLRREDLEALPSLTLSVAAREEGALTLRELIEACQGAGLEIHAAGKALVVHGVRSSTSD